MAGAQGSENSNLHCCMWLLVCVGGGGGGAPPRFLHHCDRSNSPGRRPMVINLEYLSWGQPKQLVWPKPFIAFKSKRCSLSLLGKINKFCLHNYAEIT